jgi:hypothetical protein
VGEKISNRLIFQGDAELNKTKISFLFVILFLFVFCFGMVIAFSLIRYDIQGSFFREISGNLSTQKRIEH